MYLDVLSSPLRDGPGILEKFGPARKKKVEVAGSHMKIKQHDKSGYLTSCPWQVERLVIHFVDWIFKIWPRPVPPRQKLEQCRIVSHRGIHDNKTVLENTMEALEGVISSGIWGVEIDIRWTKDLVPVVIHDRTLERLFDAPVRISEHDFSSIRKHFPKIPTLEEVVDIFGKNLHLMVELKKENYPDSDHQNGVLKEVFRKLEPKKDFHLLSLNPEMFDLIRFVSPDVCLPISVKNVGPFSRLALTKGYGGINGHYLLVGNAMVSRHHQKNQKVGTGFIESARCLFREINRGVDWIFSNDAAKLQSQVNSLH